MIALWDNGLSGTGRCANTERPLTDLLDSSERLAMPDLTRTCSINGCGRKHHAKGLCQTHLLRWRKTGDAGPAEVATRNPRLGQCTVDGCLMTDDGARGLCRSHYGRWREKGDPGTAAFPNRARGVCKLTDCGGPHEARGYCARHYDKLRSHGDPNYIAPQRLGSLAPNWRDDDVAYSTVHSRLRVQRGLAASQRCGHCDAPACTWAYDHEDGSELTDPATGFPYSLDLDRYLALCKACHSRFDIAHARRGAAS